MSCFKALLPRRRKRVQEAAKRPLGLDWFWRGFGKGLEGLGGQNGLKINIFGIFKYAFRYLVLVEFCSIFDNFDGRMVKKHFFLHGGLLVLLEGFGSKTRCLKIV